ncbi:NRAMP family divalent metal transporter [Microbacterium deminutum]|uniref:Divalent metal cation transporter n=1 Tax=Microbacterium deminutum TaxID=344164 RepID=A0ABP5C968_9MICO
MKGLFAVALGILTAIGGFVDIGDLVTNAVVGAKFGLGLAWVVLIGVSGICLYADMAGRVAAVSGRATFEIIRERLGPRVGLANLGASFLINLLTLTAEIGGIALALQLAAGVGPGLWIPVALFGVWIVIWRTKFSTMENVAGLLGLTLIVFVVALFLLKPDWGQLGTQATQPWGPASDSPVSYWYFAVALFGAAMTPYEVFFFSSGAVEEKWTSKDLATERANVFVGFPLGGILSLAIAACAAVVLLPQAIEVTTLSQVVLPVAQAGGQLALAFVIVGILAATFGAALETTLSSGYTLAQFFGWSWGKFRRPAQAARFHVAMIICLLIGGGVLATGVDPITVTELSVVFSAVALPLTYFPILVVANDPGYMGDEVNGRFRNGAGIVFLVIILVAAVAAIPLLIVSGMGSA